MKRIAKVLLKLLTFVVVIIEGIFTYAPPYFFWAAMIWFGTCLTKFEVLHFTFWQCFGFVVILRTLMNLIHLPSTLQFNKSKNKEPDAE